MAKKITDGAVPNRYSVGLNNVGSYQVSGVPWITGSMVLEQNKVHMIEFPYVSKNFTVVNNNPSTGHTILVHFNSGSNTPVTVAGPNGAQTVVGTHGAPTQHQVYRGFHYITVPPANGSVTFDTKCTKFYISQTASAPALSYSVMAELTNIPTARMYNATGTEFTGSGITE